MNLPLEPRMYVIVREDLAYKYVQGSHGLAQYAIDHPWKFVEWNNQTIVYLSVFNGMALEDLRLKLRDTPYFPGFSVFVEPDLQSPLPTALCVFDDGNNGVREHLKGLSLASK